MRPGGGGRFLPLAVLFRAAWPKSEPLRGCPPLKVNMSLYRFTLTRRWSIGPTLVWCMLNPSTADEQTDDPTIRKCIGFSRRAGTGSLVVVNLSPWRATDPKALFAAHAAGLDVLAFEENKRAIEWACAQGPCVAAWGANFKEWMAPARLTLGLACMQTSLDCLGLTSKGQPRHPLMVPYAQQLESFR